MSILGEFAICAGIISIFILALKLAGRKYSTEEKTYYPGDMASPQLWRHEFYLNGEREGQRRVWYENGQLHIQEFYKNGELEGWRKIWYANGQSWQQDFYENGELEGEGKDWYENGQLQAEEFYKNGKREGEQLEYDSKGSLISQTFWREDIKVTKKEFYSEGLSLLDNKLDEPLRGSPAPRELHLKEIIYAYL